MKSIVYIKGKITKNTGIDSSVVKDSLCEVIFLYYFLFFHIQQMPEDFLPGFVICKLVILC